MLMGPMLIIEIISIIETRTNHRIGPNSFHEYMGLKQMVVHSIDLIHIIKITGILLEDS